MKNNIFKLLMAAGILLGGACGCGKDDTTPSKGDYTPKEINVTISPESLLALEGGEAGEITIAATGKDAVNLTAEVTSAPEGWTAEIVGWAATAEGYEGKIAIVASPKTSSGSIWVAVKDSTGEVRAESCKVACKGIDAGDDPYSTPAAQCTVKAEQVGGSPVACNVVLTPTEQVSKFYYVCYSRKYIEKIAFFNQDIDWRTSIRDGIVKQLNESTFDYWYRETTAFRYDEEDDGENEVPLTPNSEYYVLVVAQLKDGSYADLEMTHLQTLPKSEREYVPEPAEHVKITVEAMEYDDIILTVEPDDTVDCFRYGMVDDYKIEDYVELYGKGWNVGYTDLWMYNLKYYYPVVSPESIITGKHTYEFPNLTPSKTYHLLIVYVDKAGETHLEVTDIRTPDKTPLVGKPAVAIVQKAITDKTVTFAFTPNADCGRYTVDIWSESDEKDFKAEYREGFPQMVIYYANRYGKVLDEAAEVTLDINDFYPMSTGNTRYWTSNNYELVVMPFDKNYTYDDTAITYTPIRYTGGTTTSALKELSSVRKFTVEKAAETPERAWATQKRAKITIINK